MKATPTYMPPEQFNQVIEAIPSLHIRKWSNYDIQMLFKICYWCALRIGEAIKLDSSNFDFTINVVYLGKTKTEKNDSAPIPPSFVPELAAYLGGKEGSLFPGLSYGTTIVWIKRLGKLLDVPAWTTPQSETGEKTKTHIFRKSIGKDLLYGEHGKKAPINIISKTLRHRGKNPIAMTFQYLKIGNDEVQDWWTS